MKLVFSSQARYTHANQFVLLFFNGIIRGNIIQMSKHAVHSEVWVLSASASLGGLLAALEPETGLTEGGLFRHISK